MVLQAVMLTQRCRAGGRLYLQSQRGDEAAKGHAAWAGAASQRLTVTCNDLHVLLHEPCGSCTAAACALSSSKGACACTSSAALALLCESHVT